MIPESEPSRAELHERIARVETILTGVDGDNGMRGQMKEMRDDVRDQMKEMRADVRTLKEKFSKMEVRLAGYVGVAVGAWALAEKYLLK